LKVRHRGKRGLGKGAWDVEVTEGDDFNQSEGTWKWIRQVIDKANNWYEKRVIGPGGDVERDVTEPLTKHTGRGAAKPREDPPS
jgi:hypothetical protein